MVCARLGVKADLDELTKLAGTDESGATLAGLQRAAQAKGLQADGLKIGLSELIQCSELAICHLWGDHFVVAQADGTGVISVTDPSAEEGKQKVPFDDFKAAYSGFTLLVSREPITPPGLDASVPDLRLDAYQHDLGTLDEGAKVERTISFRNAGAQELTISQVRPTCTCIGIGYITKSISPGGRGSISFTYDATGLRGGQAQALYVESNDPVSPLVQVEIDAVVRASTLLVSTRRVDLGTVGTETGATRELYVKDPGDGSLDIRDVTSDSLMLEVVLAGTAPPEIKERTFPVRVSIKPGASAGPFVGSITIVSNHPKEPRLTIPVTATIKGDIEVRPETLFLGFVKKAWPTTGSVALLPAGVRRFSITEVRMSSGLFTAKASAAGLESGYKVTVGLADTVQPGLLKAEMIIHTDSAVQPTITVPVSAYVEDADARKALVRILVFTSQGCNDCTLVDEEHLRAIAARVGCRVEAKRFDVADPANWQKLTSLEKKHHDVNNAIPVLFVGTDVIGGENEVIDMLEPVIAAYAAEGGTPWPDEGTVELQGSR